MSGDLGLRDPAESGGIEIDPDPVLAAQRGRALLALSQDLGDALTAAHVAKIVTGHLRATAGVYYAAIALLDGNGTHLQFVNLDGMPDSVRQNWSDVPMGVSSPLTRAVSTRKAIFHPSRAALLEEYPGVEDAVDAVAINAYGSLPLVASGRVIGALSMSWEAERPFTMGDRRFLGTVAGLSAQAVERARLFDDLTRQVDRISRLQHATAALAAAHTRDDVLAAILPAAQTVLGAANTSIGLVDWARRVLIFHDLESGRMGIPAQLYRFPLSVAALSTQAVLTGLPQMAASPQELEERFSSEQIGDFLAGTDEQSWVCGPLIGSRGPSGVLRVAWNHPRPASESSLAFLSTLAGQCAQALERIELRNAEHAAVVRLTTSLLPETMPAVSGLNLAARLLAAPHGNAPAGSSLGGDWWDALPLPGRRVAQVVGDVMGKGLNAAAIAGRVRNALRLALVREPDPARAFAAVEELLLLTEPEDQIVTVSVAVLDLDSGSVTLVSAGHPPPMMVIGDAASLVPVPPGTSLGLPGPREVIQVPLPDAATLLLYSDGLIENRARSLTDGFAALLSAAERSLTSNGPELDRLEEWIDEVIHTLLPGSGQDDDVTLLAARITPTAVQGPGTAVR
jgi:serine phosphatase RsbU (regulator of sigma subunit)